MQQRLAPLLFLLFIINMPAITTNITMLFADISNRECTINCNHSVGLTWANMWQTKFNESKCSILHIGKDNPKNDYMMGK